MKRLLITILLVMFTATISVAGIYCDGICFDLNWDDSTDEFDFVIVIGEYSKPIEETHQYCIQGLYSEGDYVDLYIILDWAWIIDLWQTGGHLHLCFKIPILGDTNEAPFSAPINNPNLTSFDNLIISGIGQSHIKLTKDSGGDICQINMGGISYLDGEMIIAPCSIAHEGSTIYIGIQGEGEKMFGRPILDAAFENDYIYVTPIVVDPNLGEPYRAVAKLSESFEIVQVYEVSGREIEIDENNLYIASSDDVQILDKHTGNLKASIDINAPVALCVADKLYLTSRQMSPDANSTFIYGLSKENLALERTIVINEMGHVTGITKSKGVLYAVGFIMEDIPEYPSPLDPFYEACLAKIPNDIDYVTAQHLVGLDLPVSIVSVDMVNFVDFAYLALRWHEGFDLQDLASFANEWLK